MNCVILSGRLVAEPDLRQTLEGESVCSFRIAVARPNVKDKTDFIKCVAWHGQAEFVGKNFTKGQFIEVHGILKNSDWVDNAGTRHYALEVKCDYASFCGAKEQPLTACGTKSEVPFSSPYTIKDDEFVTQDLPFGSE